MSYKGIFQRLSCRLLLIVSFELVVGLFISLGTLLVFAGLSGEVSEGETRRFDTTILSWIHSTFPDWLGLPMRLVTALGYAWVVTPLLLLAAYIFYRKNLKLSAALLVISVPGAAIFGIFLKSLYERARPEFFETAYTASSYSFPSGHAVTAVSFYGVLIFLIARRFRFGRRWTIAASGVVLMLLIGFSRLYFGVHYPSDVIAGYLAAITWVGAVSTVLVSWRSLRRHQKGGSSP